VTKLRDNKKNKLSQQVGGGNSQKQQKSEAEQWAEGCGQQTEEAESECCEQSCE
jgi:hypothetical protein